MARSGWSIIARSAPRRTSRLADVFSLGLSRFVRGRHLRSLTRLYRIGYFPRMRMDTISIVTDNFFGFGATHSSVFVLASNFICRSDFSTLHA